MIESIHSFLVHPAKHEDEPPEISKSIIEPHGRLFSILKSVYERAPEECNIDIVFCPKEDGKKENDCRSCLVNYAKTPSLTNGLSLAYRLQRVTTNRSGLGLLFLIKGELKAKHIVVISRFPADQGILAEEHEDKLSVEFIERIFMKSARAYKSAYYAHESFESGFWLGKAIDRQISGPRELSEYWIRDFLNSDLTTTSAAGTKRLAVAIREAVRKTKDLEIRRELVSAATLIRSQNGKVSSARNFIKKLGVSEQALKEIESAFVRPVLMDQIFTFDQQEFNKHAHYRAVELDNGAMLVAEDENFDNVFQKEHLEIDSKIVKYSSQGIVVDERLRKIR